MRTTLTRRDFISGAAALPSAFLLPSSARGAKMPSTPSCGSASQQTPPQTPGPFFRSGSPNRQNFTSDGDGRIFSIAGFVTARNCEPVQGAIVELWHADNSGEYDRQGYRYRGHQRTDNLGRYLFETIRPDGYRFRTPHFHVTIASGAGNILTTQLYFPDEPENEKDFLYDPRLDMKLDAENHGRFDFVVSA